jgi:hypothetical protein
MAYRTFDSDTMSAILADDRRAGQAVRSAPSTDFGAFEAAAVWLGQHDDPASLSVDGFSHRLRRLFRLEPGQRLADPRLEGLRRLTVVLRHGFDALVEDEKASARDAGVSEAQIAALEARFAG